MSKPKFDRASILEPVTNMYYADYRAALKLTLAVLDAAVQQTHAESPPAPLWWCSICGECDGHVELENGQLCPVRACIEAGLVK